MNITIPEWYKRERLPTLEDITDLDPPTNITHIEWVEYQAWGRTKRKLQIWLLGCRKPLTYRRGGWR